MTTFVKERVTVRFSSVKKFGPYKTNPTLSDNDQHVRKKTGLVVGLEKSFR